MTASQDRRSVNTGAPAWVREALELPKETWARVLDTAQLTLAERRVIGRLMHEAPRAKGRTEA